MILNPEYWLLNTALAEPTKEVLQAPLLASEYGACRTDEGGFASASTVFLHDL
jgi:hypothetical protein